MLIPGKLTPCFFLQGCFFFFDTMEGFADFADFRIDAGRHYLGDTLPLHYQRARIDKRNRARASASDKPCSLLISCSAIFINHPWVGYLISRR